MSINTDINTIKKVAKNLGQSLKNNYDTKLSHAAALNLASHAFGYENYNTAKALLETQDNTDTDNYESSFHLIRSMGISKDKTHEIISWYKEYIGYGSEIMVEVLHETMEYIKDSEYAAVNEIYLSLWSMFMEDVFYFMPENGKNVYNYSLGYEDLGSSVAEELKMGNIAGVVQASYYNISTNELKKSIEKSNRAGKQLRKTASVSLVNHSDVAKVKEIVRSLEYDQISRSSLENILETTYVDEELKKLQQLKLEIIINGTERIAEAAINQFGKINEEIYMIEVSSMVEKCFE